MGRLKYKTQQQIVTEAVGDVTYEYVPLSEHIVMAKGFCGGRPTFKYRRLEPKFVIFALRRGEPRERIATGYELTTAQIDDAVRVAELYPEILKD